MGLRRSALRIRPILRAGVGPESDPPLHHLHSAHALLHASLRRHGAAAVGSARVLGRDWALRCFLADLSP